MKQKSIWWVGIALTLIIFSAGFWLASQRAKTSRSNVDTSRAAVVQKIQALGNLEATSFTLEKIIQAGDSNASALITFFFGDNLLLIAHGQVVAGFDLSLLTPESVVIKGDEVAVQLGAPKILSVTLDNSKTVVYDRKTGFLRKPAKDLESEARAAAEASIKEAACNAGILEEAEKQGKGMIEKMFQFAGFKRVIVETKHGTC
jgi:hypothetical protein